VVRLHEGRRNMFLEHLQIKRIRITLAAIIISFFVVIYDLFIGGVLIGDYIERIISKIGEITVDEVVMVLAFISIGILADITLNLFEKRRLERIANEQVRTFRATLSTIHDLVNNSLNGLQLLRLEAASNNALSEESLHTFDSIIQSTAEGLRMIGKIEKIKFKRISDNLEIISVGKNTKG
jgi:ABC-type multidrug transport system fused ATPase/permease subunit